MPRIERGALAVPKVICCTPSLCIPRSSILSISPNQSDYHFLNGPCSQFVCAVKLPNIRRLYVYMWVRRYLHLPVIVLTAHIGRDSTTPYDAFGEGMVPPSATSAYMHSILRYAPIPRYYIPLTELRGRRSLLPILAPVWDCPGSG